MNSILNKGITLFSLTAATLLSPVFATAADTMEKPVARVDEMLVTMVERVAAINYETREITLEDEYGKQVTVKAGDAIKRLDEVDVGDLVEIDYYTSIAFELREPTEEEIENPLQILEDSERATMDQAPAGIAIQMMKAVCTIEGLDRPSGTVTLEGPLGGLNVVQVKDVSNLPKMRIGDTVVVTYSEAVAIELTKVSLED